MAKTGKPLGSTHVAEPVWSVMLDAETLDVQAQAVVTVSLTKLNASAFLRGWEVSMGSMEWCVADATDLLPDAAGNAAVLVAHERSVGLGS